MINLEESGAALAWFLRSGFIPSNDFESFKSIEHLQGEKFNQQLLYFKIGQSSGKSKYEFSAFDKEWRNTIRRKISIDSKIGVMLSGGKDSTAIMYGLAREGYKNVVAYTYVPVYGENESMEAGQLCTVLGFEHKVICANYVLDYHAWVEVLNKSKIFSADFAFPATCRLAKEMAEDGVEVLVDGMGNDIYMGHIPPLLESRLRNLALTKFFGKSIWGKEIFFSMIPSWKLKYLINSLMMHPIERMFPGSRFSITELKRLNLPVDTTWNSLQYLTSQVKDYPENIARAYVRGIFFDNYCAMQKSRSASDAYGLQCIFPFEDVMFAEFYNKYEIQVKFDWKNRINKVALRTYLEDLRAEHGVSDASFNQKKGSFRFNFKEFLLYNREFIKSEFTSISQTQPELYSYIESLNKSTVDYVDVSKIYLIASYLL